MTRRRRWMIGLAGVVLLALVVACAVRSRGPPPFERDRPTRFVSFNVHRCEQGRDRVLAEIRRLQPVVLFLQELPVTEAEQLPRDLHLPAAAFVAHRNFPGEGVAIAARFPLRDVRPLFDDEGRAFALTAHATIGGRDVFLASVHLTATTRVSDFASSAGKRQAQIERIRAAWHDAGRLPAVIGGDLNQPPLGGNYDAITSDFRDVHRQLGKDEWTCDAAVRVRLDYVLTTNDWRPLDAGTGEAGHSDHRAVWVVATRP